MLDRTPPNSYKCSRYVRIAGRGLFALALVLPGCQAFSSTSDRLVTLVEQSARDAGTLQPRESTVAPMSGASSAAARDPHPGTTNPPADALRYEALAGDPRRAPGAMGDAGTPQRLRLSDSFRTAQQGGREFRAAEEDYLLAAIGLLIERHLWGPRFFNDTSVTLSGAGVDGNFEHALDAINTLRATQRLPYGGQVEARWVFDASEQLRQQATGRYTQSSTLALSGTIPLLRGAGTAARESLIQGERDLIYQARTFERSRRQLLVDIAGDFFDLVQTKARITNQESQLQSLRDLERMTAARVDAGRLDAFQTSVAGSRVLAAQADLAGLRESYTLQLDRFKIRLGMTPDQPFDIGEIDLSVPRPGITLDDATRLALDLRLDLQNRRDQVDDERRRLKNARNGLLPDLSATGSLSVPTDPSKRVGGLTPSPGDLDYSAGLNLSLPLDRENERLTLRQQQIRLAQRERDLAQFRDNVVANVRAALRQVDVANLQLDLAERQVQINRRRLEGQQLKADELVPQTLVDSLLELNSAENNRDRAATDLRKAILNFLLETDQLRVSRDGQFEPLPGMDAQAAGPAPAPRTH